MTRKAAADEEIVQFPVPRRHLTDVTKFLAWLEETPRASRAKPRDNNDRPWTKNELKYLRQLLRNRLLALQLLDFTAALEGQPLTFADLCDVTGEDPKDARGELATLTSIVRKYFGRDQWPADAHWESGGQCYRMRPEVSVLWREVAEEF